MLKNIDKPTWLYMTEKNIHPKDIFNPVLFWDAKEINLETHANYIIARVLDYGDEHDVKALRGIYADEKIINVVKKDAD